MNESTIDRQSKKLRRIRLLLFDRRIPNTHIARNADAPFHPSYVTKVLSGEVSGKRVKDAIAKALGKPWSRL